MRQHFHRCGHLRVISVDASDLSHARKGGSRVIEELCEAHGLARCVGLVECDVLAPAQKRDLLGARATRLREEEGGASPLADVPDPRSAELSALESELRDEREQIVADNRRRLAEAGGALQRNPRPMARSQESELPVAGASVFGIDDLLELRSARLDAIDRALEAMRRGRYGDCARCGRPIETMRLRLTPDTVLCKSCAKDALPVSDPLGGEAPEPMENEFIE